MCSKSCPKDVTVKQRILTIFWLNKKTKEPSLWSLLPVKIYMPNATLKNSSILSQSKTLESLFITIIWKHGSTYRRGSWCNPLVERTSHRFLTINFVNVWLRDKLETIERENRLLESDQAKLLCSMMLAILSIKLSRWFDAISLMYGGFERGSAVSKTNLEM